MNKKLTIRSTVALVVLGAAVLVSATVVSAHSAGSLLVPKSEIKFADVPGMAGVQLAQLEGDPGKGASHFFLKFAGGFAAPLHHHTANHSATVVAGTLVLTVGGKEQKLPPGSFFAFSDKTPHMTSCEAGADCVLAMDVRGKWDVVVEKEAKK
jgi:quercetin dioxygenase-like cupin family protein